MIKIGVITASDRASAGIYEDISGVAIQETMKKSGRPHWSGSPRRFWVCYGKKRCIVTLL